METEIISFSRLGDNWVVKSDEYILKIGRNAQGRFYYDDTNEGVWRLFEVWKK